jgi:spermidine synthase
LGLGGGSNAKIVRNFWPDIQIKGVELDPLMIDMGIKYLGLDKLNIEIVVKDALEYCIEEVTNNKKYDLILMDVYVADNIPSEFDTEEFILHVKSLMTPSSLSVFNRLYYDEKIQKALQFESKLKKHFSKIESVFPEANVMFLCRN